MTKKNVAAVGLATTLFFTYGAYRYFRDGSIWNGPTTAVLLSRTQNELANVPYVHLEHRNPQQGFIGWPVFEVSEEACRAFKGASLKETIRIVKNEKKIPVLIFREPTRFTEPPNPELMEIKSEPEEEIAMIRLAEWRVFPPFPSALGQYLAPYLHNAGQIHHERPYIDRGIILLSPSAKRNTVIHEYLHSLYQTKVYSNPTPLTANRKVHPFVSTSLDSERLKNELEKAVQAFNDGLDKGFSDSVIMARQNEVFVAYLKHLQAQFYLNREHFVEEALVHQATFRIAVESEFSTDEQESSLWKYFLYLDDLHQFFDNEKNDPNFIILLQNRGALDSESKGRLAWLLAVMESDRRELRERYRIISELFMDRRWNNAIREMEEKGRITVDRSRQPWKISVTEP